MIARTGAPPGSWGSENAPVWSLLMEPAGAPAMVSMRAWELTLAPDTGAPDSLSTMRPDITAITFAGSAAAATLADPPATPHAGRAVGRRALGGGLTSHTRWARNAGSSRASRRHSQSVRPAASSRPV